MNSIANNKPTVRTQTADKHPLVTVIIPTYNRAPLLMDTLSSLQAQPYRPLEVIIVNDGSTDDTQDQAIRWISAVKSDSELRCHLIQQENKGAAAARNHGKRHATGKYIHFLDSDDVVGPHFYPQLVAVMATASDCAFAWGDWLSAEDATTAIAKLPDPNHAAAAPSLTPYNNAWCGLFRAALIPAGLEWNESLQNHNDWDYTTRFLLTNPVRLLHLAVPLLVYRTHAGPERLGRVRTPKSLQAVLNAVDDNAKLLPTGRARKRYAYTHVLAQRFSSEYIVLLFNAMELNLPKVKKQAAWGVFRHATCGQSWFWNLVAMSLFCLLPFSGTALGRNALKQIRRSFGDMQLTISAE